jgi:hypothetical protein
MTSKPAFPVDLGVPTEYERNATADLMRWQTLEGANSTMWKVGNTNDGRKLIFDVPAKAVGFLLYGAIGRGVRLETRPRDPRRPLP